MTVSLGARAAALPVALALALCHPFIDAAAAEPTLEPSPAGLLLIRRNERYRPHCTVILTRPNLVLTARHCIDGLEDPAELKVYFPSEGIRSAVPGGTQAFCLDGRSTCPANNGDIARVLLDRPYHWIPLASLAAAPARASGSRRLVQGYGDSTATRTDRGLLLQGRVTLGDCVCARDSLSGSGVLCSRSTSAASEGEPPGLVNFSGHSGAPLFSTVEPGFVLHGMANQLARGCDENNTYENVYLDLASPEFSDWLSAVFCEGDCRDGKGAQREILLAVPEARVGAGRQSAWPVRIPSRVLELRVLMNHQVGPVRPTPSMDLNVVMPGEIQAECVRHEGVESCHVSNPPPGAYSIGIQRKSGNPAYQLTVVAIYEE